MPILTPTGLQFFLQDLVNEVIIKTENRTTDVARALNWLRDALIEITADPELRNEFDELEELGQLFNLTGNVDATIAVQEYPFTTIVPAGDYNVNTLDVLLWTNPPQNTARIRLESTSYQEADMITPFPGQPVKWYRFSDNIGFVPVPDKNYQVQARIYKMHPINDNVLGQTLILIGRNWNEVLIWAAVERGFIELLQYEKATAVHTLLYGDPSYPNRPGIIDGKKKRREKEHWREQKALRPIVRSYGYSRGSGR